MTYFIAGQWLYYLPHLTLSVQLFSFITCPNLLSERGNEWLEDYIDYQWVTNALHDAAKGTEILRPEQNGQYFADSIFKCNWLTENLCTFQDWNRGVGGGVGWGMGV